MTYRHKIFSLQTKIVLFLFAITIISSCSSKYHFSKHEKNLIYQETENMPFRVLQITNPEDSVLLRTSCNDINISNNRDLEILISRLKATLMSENGVGIAAPQVGIMKNIFLFIRSESPETIVVAINPKIVNHPDETICFERDGCLSIPDVAGNSIRYPWIEVEYYTETGILVREKLEGYSRETGFTSVVFQHEYDHLQGVLFIDKLCDIDQQILDL